jgi:hypothetical protein
MGLLRHLLLRLIIMELHPRHLNTALLPNLSMEPRLRLTNMRLPRMELHPRLTNMEATHWRLPIISLRS